MEYVIAYTLDTAAARADRATAALVEREARIEQLMVERSAWSARRPALKPYNAERSTIRTGFRAGRGTGILAERKYTYILE